MNILIITDDPLSTTKLRRQLENTGIATQTTTSRGIDKIWFSQLHLIYIHPPITKINYKNILKKIQNLNWSIPIILPFQPPHEIANSYILPEDIKPHEIPLAIYSILRRSQQKDNKNIKYKDLTLDPYKRIVKREKHTTRLRNKEFGMLELMMRSPGAIITRNQFTELLWDRNTTLLSNTLECHMSNLRRKIDRGFSKKLIHTVPYVGYRFGYDEDA